MEDIGKKEEERSELILFLSLEEEYWK